MIRDACGLMRYRIRLARDRTAVTSQTHSLPGRYDIQPRGVTMHPEKAIKGLSGTRPARPNDRMIPRSCAGRIAGITEEIKGAGKETGAQAERNDNAKLPMGMAGIETPAAMLLVSGTGDVRRFGRPEKLVPGPACAPAYTSPATGSTTAARGRPPTGAQAGS